jgi:hypothetical protein
VGGRDYFDSETVMSSVTLIGCTRLGEFLADCELDALDEAQYQHEQRACLINARADEINLARFKSLSDEDMALALETLSTYPMCISGIKRDMLAHGESFALIFETYVLAALLSDSIREARAEFATLDSIKDGEGH